jgi:ATP-dependent helicase/DNAse subunit B
VYHEKWVKLEVDLRSYPRAWKCKQFAETLAQLYAEEENMYIELPFPSQIDHSKLDFNLRFFRYNSKNAQEDVVEIDGGDQLQRLREMVDFAFNLDYFWLKLID